MRRWWPRDRRGRGRSGHHHRRAACRRRRTPPTGRPWPGRPHPRGPRSAATTNSAASAARSPARSSPTKSPYPGVSIRLILTSSCSSGATDSATERCWRTAAGSWSPTVVPVDHRTGPRDRARCARAAPPPAWSSPTPTARRGPRCGPWTGPRRWGPVTGRALPALGSAGRLDGADLTAIGGPPPRHCDDARPPPRTSASSHTGRNPGHNPSTAGRPEGAVGRAAGRVARCLFPDPDTPSPRGSRFPRRPAPRAT